MNNYSKSTWVRNTGQGGAWTWLFQRLTGIFIVVIILLHFGMMHMSGGGEITYKVVAARLSNPMWKCFDIAFLVFALYHGLAGAWVVASDYVKNSGWRMFIYSSLTLVGVGLFSIGAVTIIAFPFK
jgi:succinate dehydrogenase / fumarate reductase, membrane anchor subunit